MISKDQLKLPSISQAGQQSLELLSDDLIEINYLADYLGKDPVISAALLKYANSPIYRRRVEVKGVRKAVSLLGSKTCKMVVGLTILQTYKSENNTLTENIWSHCINVAAAARIIAEKYFPDIKDEIETTALMHDMGMLVLACSFPDLYSKLLEDCIADPKPIEKAEDDVFGTNHGAIISLLAPLLKLPQVTSDCIARFHSEDSLFRIVSEQDKHLISCQLAHIIVQKYENYVSGQKCFNEFLSHDLDAIAILLGVSDHDMNNLIEDCDMMLDVI